MVNRMPSVIASRLTGGSNLSAPPSNDQELVDQLIRFVQRERPNLVQDWGIQFQKLDSKAYTSLGKEDITSGSEHFLDTFTALLVEKNESRVLTLMETSLKSIITKRIVQGVNLEWLLEGSTLHRDVILNRLLIEKDYKSLDEGRKLAIVNLVYHNFQIIYNGIARMAHEAAISEIDRLRRFNENIITSITEGIIIEDHNGIITYTNPRFASMLGFQKNELVGEQWEKLVPKEFHRLFRDEASKRSLGMEGKFEANLLTKDLKTLPVLISAKPLYEAGRYKGVVSVITDVTEMKRMQDELQRSKADMERLNLGLQRQARTLEEDNLKLRAVLNIEPVKETEAKGERTYALEAGYIYLILSTETDTSFRIFQDLVKHGAPGLCLSRVLPDTIRKVYSLEKTPILWLTTNKVPNQHCITPSNIVDLSSAVINFLEKSKDGVVLFDGLEYLISQNNFRSILNLIQLLNDKIMLNRGKIILPLDPDIIDPKELHQIMKEVRLFEDKKSKDLRRLSGPPIM
jgi:PAS domain S-box-containing protein